MPDGLNQALWRQLNEEVFTAMREWRQEHPKATLRQIEIELDARLSLARARMLEDLALTSQAASWQDAPNLARPLCPDCGLPLEQRGAHSRSLLTTGDQQLTLQRHYGVCRSCQSGFFPPG